MNQPCLVIMAAGMGSRFGGPKQTTPVDEHGPFSAATIRSSTPARAGFRKRRVRRQARTRRRSFARRASARPWPRAFDVRLRLSEARTRLPGGLRRARRPREAVGHRPRRAVRRAPRSTGRSAVINADDYLRHRRPTACCIRVPLAVPRSRAVACHGGLPPAQHRHGQRQRVARRLPRSGTACSSSITERTHIEQRGADAAYTEDGAHFIDLPGRYDGVHELLGLLAAVPARARAPVPGVPG